MKKLYLSIIALLVFTQIRAYDCRVGLLCYNLNSNDQTATVTYSAWPFNNEYAGLYGNESVCLSGKDIQIPSSISYNNVEYTVTAIGENAFFHSEGYIGMSSVTIPSSVTSIGANAFYNCKNLTAIVIPSSVTSMGFAFSGCSGLTSVTIEEGVNSIGNSTFSGCSSLTSVTIPNSVTSIGEQAFRDCSRLTSVTIPNSVTSIGKQAFSDCDWLTDVTIPNSVKSIGGSAFSGTAWDNNLPNGLIYAGKVAYKYKGDMPPNTIITLQDGTIGIAGLAFKDCVGLTGVTIPNSVTSIGDYAFKDCI